MAGTSVPAFFIFKGCSLELRRCGLVQFYVYILYSEDADRYYCGQTDNLEKRLAQHNDPDNTFTKTTHRFKGPWNLVWHCECSTRTAGIRLERKIKQRGIRRYLSDIKAGGC